MDTEPPRSALAGAMQPGEVTAGEWPKGSCLVDVVDAAGTEALVVGGQSVRAHGNWDGSPRRRAEVCRRLFC